MQRLLLAAALILPMGTVHAQTVPASAKAQPMIDARGTFDVKMAPVPNSAGEGINTMSLDKVYHGELDATAHGQMMSAGDPATGNAGYVAIERITGKLVTPTGTRTGSFALMQNATMATGNKPEMTVTIVPGSGTGELSGIYGSLTILIAAGKHSYVLSYAFAGK